MKTIKGDEMFKSRLDLEIDDYVGYIGTLEKGSIEYEKAVYVLRELCESRGIKNDPSRISADTALTSATYILGILSVLLYEHGHVVVSKAFGLLRKL